MEAVMAEKLPKGAEKGEELTPVQRLAKLDQERAELVASAKGDALQKATSAVEELNALGFHYRLIDGDGISKTIGARTPKDEACEVCGFKTDKPHDKRSHRGHPAPFTAEEVAAKGWTIVQ
jgi:hypothetical protein